MVDLISDNEDEIELPQVLPMRDIEPMLTSDDSEGDVRIPGDRGKVIMAWGKKRRIVRRTKGRKKMRVSPERPSGEPEYLDFINGTDTDFTSRIGGFYESSLSSDRRD
jgi:hypothetical protein